MTDWQQGYSDGYLPSKFRPYPQENKDYLAGYIAGQSDYNQKFGAKNA